MRARSARVPCPLLVTLFGFALAAAGCDDGGGAAPDGRSDVMGDGMVGMVDIMPDVTPDTMPDVTPDAMPDVTPDAMPDVISDATNDVSPDAMPDAAPDAGPDPVPGADWLSWLPGLWSGPATRTPLGDFPLMNMDLRAADARTLFSRFDLDPEDGLRFAFAVETVEGTPTLVFRNGGYFLGLLRDTRAALIEAQGDTLRFCHRERGCAYLDARWVRDGADALSLLVDVRGTRHLEWRARRVEPRALPDDFAPTPGPYDGPFPEMPSLEVRVRWRAALADATPVWLLVSSTPCGLGGACTPARIMSAEAPAGATEVTLRIDQIHPGPMVVNAVLDRNANFRQRLFPDSGDGLAGLDRQVQIGAEGTTRVDVDVLFDVP